MNQYLLLLTSIPFTPACAAADTPPERKLSIANSSLSMPTAAAMARKGSLALVYDSETFSFSVSCVDDFYD